MGGTAIKTRLISARSFIILIVLIGVIYFLLVDVNNNSSEPNLNTKIQVKLISSTEMSKAVYTRQGNGTFINWVDINLSQEEIENIVTWINSVSGSEITELDHIPPNLSISAGIVFRLKTNKEIRIQYDLEKIYITRTDIKNKQVIYSINQEELKNFFDKHLKGFHFGEDKVKAF